MNSSDDYEKEASKSDSDDDMSPDAVYKRSRQRTRGPTPPRFLESAMARSPSLMSVEGNEASVEEVQEQDPELQRRAAMSQRRLAVIHALVGRANALYREQMALKRHHPALTRVKEEEED